MKQYLIALTLLFTTMTSSQNGDYNKLWKDVEQFEIEGLPQSALKIIEQIYLNAQKDGNHNQVVKSLLFKSKFALILEEDAQLKIISDFKKEIAQSNFPSKNILENILANLYWQYFQQNRWKLYNRTKVSSRASDTGSSASKTDFRTWDLQTLFNEISLHFENSLQNGLMLQLEDLKKYNTLLTTTKGSKTYRPTLFDFLTHNALTFYKTDENSITKPAYKFELEDPKLLSNSKVFSQLVLESKDSTSQQLKALKLYQELIAFHLKNNNAKALAAINIERLHFVNRHATFSDKQHLLLESLNSEKNTISQTEISGLYDYEIATIYFEQSNTYQPHQNKTHRWKAKQALELCNSVIAQTPKSDAAQKCHDLKQRILQETLQIKTESYLSIDQFSKLLVTYKNIESLQLKLYKLSSEDLRALNKIYREEEQLKFIKELTLETQWRQTLINEDDHQTHSVEITVPKLKNGNYLIYAEVEDKTKTWAFGRFEVTNFALEEKTSDSHTIYRIFNRNNGQAIPNAKVVLTYQKSYRNNNTSSTTKTTNTNGEISIKNPNRAWHNVIIEVSKHDQKAHFGNYYINRSYSGRNNDNETVEKGFIFTDRSIYRPGQTVYFKGIALSRKGNVSEVLANEKFYVQLYDVNHSEIKELELKSNEFGSISGEFILPNSGLTGNYFIEMSGQKNDIDVTSYFSVEEYKRPKFEAKFKPLTESVKINDSVTVTGEALAYAGSNITNAKVTYRIKRTVQYPRWYYWYRPWFHSESQEIAHGETTTDDSGKFDITFKALADPSVDKENLPVFNYEVTADVTDINGETRSATTIVNVGYHSLTANMIIASELDKTNKKHRLQIDTKNLNGEFVPAKGTVKIYKLQAPETVLRNRPWPAPDYKLQTKEEFKTQFPHEAYNNENDSKYWNKGELVFDTPFDTKTSKELILGNMKRWESGLYKIELETQDRFGQKVKDETQIVLFSSKDKTLADNQLFSITTDKKQYQPNDVAEITLASAANNLAVFVEVEKDKKIINKYTILLNNDKKTLKVPVTKNDLGGFVIHYTLAAFNSVKASSIRINVPYPKTDLEIETTTFRDRLQPGTEETWSFKVKGAKGDKISAELLASMYDASLDQFKPHSWQFDPIHLSNYYSNYRKNASNSFRQKNLRIHNNYRIVNQFRTQSYDQLNWFGFHLTKTWMRDQYLRNLRLKRVSKYDTSIKAGTVQGTIYDETGTPLPGVNIVVKGTSIGTQTDFDGAFSIQVKKGEILIFSYIGYRQEVKVDKRNSLTVTLGEDSATLDEVVVTGYATEKRSKSMKLVAPLADMEADETKEVAFGVQIQNTKNIQDTVSLKKDTFDNITIRKNLQETAFFYPNLRTDKDGNVSFSFTTPEALTKWKLQLVAHTKTLESATKTLEAVTQKELMVIPNAPRFLREGDQITISTKIANLSDKTLSGQAKLVLTDAVTGKDITNSLMSEALEDTKEKVQDETSKASVFNITQNFSVNAKGNTQVSWNLTIPDNVQAVQYKILASTGEFSDGEQNALPVLSNRMLVTESLPMWVRSNQTKTFTLDKLALVPETLEGSTLKHHKLTLEMTSNPAWYAVQALPYLMEYPYDCNEQTFSRYYANALASYIVNSNPRIKEVFDQWASTNSGTSLVSNLEKNQELKSLLIQETPWLRDAQSETEQKKRIALLFDLNKMTNELDNALRKLEQNQLGNGAWSWFKGGRENRFITQHIVSGFGHLKQLDVIDLSSRAPRLSAGRESRDLNNMISEAIKYLDKEFVQEYKDIKKYNKDVDMSKDHLSYSQLQYLYMRSFFPDIKTSKEVEDIRNYYHSQIRKYWLKRSLYAKGLMTLVMHRSSDHKTAGKILNSLKENSITSEELGMYWKENTNSWFWYQAPIETQALLIETFAEAGTVIQNEAKNLETIDNLKIWLLKNKQTNRWKTTKATTEAVYALLLQGSDWLSTTDMVSVSIGNQTIEPSKQEDIKTEAGTGYFKTSWSENDITPEMANVTITKKDKGIAWGGLYWQYFEDLDKITSAETPLKLKKKLFLKTNTDRGETLSEINENTKLNIGDLVSVRIELRSDRAMEFVHMKDMRAAGFEPVNVLSQYKWQDGLGYYESTKDAATHFFFDYLPKGIYVFEYDLRVNNAGNMSNGITTIQSMYAPEFSSHSEGIRVKIQ